jgi:Tfp pilus assembly protein PilN
MNANELADLIECACCAYQKEAAAMLRQQAAEIEAGIELVKKFQEEREALKKENDHLLMVHNYKGAGFR